MAEETQNSEPSWSWPARSPAGGTSSTSSAPVQASQPVSPAPSPHAETIPETGAQRDRLDQLETYASEPALDPLPGESVRSWAIRTAIVAVASSGVSLAASFGFELSGTQTAQLIGFVTGVSTLAALVLAGRKRRG